jgi:hypothetical protein
MLDDDFYLVTIWNDQGRAYLSFYRTVLERKAEPFIEDVEALIHPSRVGKETTSEKLSPDLLAVLTEAYAMAAEANR